MPLTDHLRTPRRRPLSRFVSRLVASLCAASMLATAHLPLAQAQNRLPSLGDSASDEFNIGTERRLGDRIMRDIRRDPDYLDDAPLRDYVDALWQPLLKVARERGEIGNDTDARFAWETFLVRDKTVNAFALPGGYVGVHLGLIGITASRDELASVLAHELTHVTQRHIARSIAVSSRQSMIGLATMILGVLAASKSRSPDGANAVITGGQALAMQGQLNFSRDMEREADRIGFTLLSGAGYSPAGMAAMFEKLEHASRLNDNAGYPYLRSHPLNAERIGEARSRLGASPPPSPVSLLTHAAAQGRARVLMDTRVDALRRWQAMDALRDGSSSAEKLSAAYSSALASTLLRDWARADSALEIAKTQVRGNPRGDAQAEREVTMLQAQSLLARGQTADAAALVDTMQAAGAPASRAVMMLAAQAALALPKDHPSVRRSADQLQTWTTLHPTDASAWQLLGRTWTLLDQPLRALRAEGESRVSLADYNGALDRFRAGQKLARSSSTKADFVDASILDARIRDVEGLRRQQQLEEKNEG